MNTPWHNVDEKAPESSCAQRALQMNWNLESLLSPGRAPVTPHWELTSPDCSSAVDLENSKHGWQLGEGGTKCLRSCCQPKCRLQRAHLALLCGRACSACGQGQLCVGLAHQRIFDGRREKLVPGLTLSPARTRQLWQPEPQAGL